MSVVIIGDREQRQIERLIEHATARPVTWDQMRNAAFPATGTTELTLDQRQPGFERPASEHLILGNVRVAYSHEQQPAGMFRHLSASVKRPGKLPHPEAMVMICEAFHFTEAICDVMRRKHPAKTIVGHIWLEEFEPGHMAINVIELIEGTASQEGHA